MKLFSPQKTSAPKAKTSATHAPSKKLAQKILKKEISASDIKEKLAAHVETSDTAKNMAIKNSKKLGDGFMSDEVKAAPLLSPPVPPSVDQDPNPADFVLKSDIAQNDPKDTNTQEKLKSVISKGAFNFNPREREALEKILAN